MSDESQKATLFSSEEDGLIELAELEEGEFHMVFLEFNDGCQFSFAPYNRVPDDWKLDFPGGFKVTCPHDLVINITAEELDFEEETDE